MGQVSLVGSTNTVYVTTPNSITVTPSNIDKFFSQTFTPTITTKNNISSATGTKRFFHFFLGDWSSTEWSAFVELGSFSATAVKNTKTYNNVTALSSSYWGDGINRCKMGDIGLAIKYNPSLIPQIIVVESSASTEEAGTEISEGATTYTKSLSGFNQSVSLSNPQPVYPTGFREDIFGDVQGYCSANITSTATNASWSWSGGASGSGTHYLTGNTTSKITSNGKTTTTSSLTATVNTGTITNETFNASATVTNTLGGSTTINSTTYSVQPYNIPILSNVLLKRTNSDAEISLNYQVNSLNKRSNITQTITYNPITVNYTIVNNNDPNESITSSYNIVNDGEALTDISGDITIPNITLQSDNDSYTLTASITDRLGGTSNEIIYILPSAFQYMDIIPNTDTSNAGIAFGETAADEKFLIGSTLRPFLKLNLSNNIPNDQSLYNNAILLGDTAISLQTNGLDLKSYLGKSNPAKIYKITDDDNVVWLIKEYFNGLIEAFGWYRTGSTTYAGTIWASPIYYQKFTISFPSGLFTEDPSQIQLTSNNIQWIGLACESATKKQCVIRAIKPTSTAYNFSCYIYAVQYPS